jgi:hypothetical protein
MNYVRHHRLLVLVLASLLVAQAALAKVLPCSPVSAHGLASIAMNDADCHTTAKTPMRAVEGDNCCPQQCACAAMVMAVRSMDTARFEQAPMLGTLPLWHTAHVREIILPPPIV